MAGRPVAGEAGAAASGAAAIPLWYLGLAALSLAGSIGYTLLPEDTQPRVLAFLALQGALALPALAAWKLFRGRPLGLAWVLFAAAAVRLATLPSELIFENDVFRYLWDARVSAAGINPYLYAPAAPELAALVDDWIWEQIPYRQVPTAYPPLAQVLFLLARTLFGESVIGLQLVMGALDCGTVAALYFLGRKLGAPRAAAAYALHPLAMKEFAQSAHIDTAAVLLLVVTALLLVHRKERWAAVALAGATLVKVFPVFLLPALARRLGWKNLALYAAVVAAPLLLVLASGAWPFGGLEAFSRFWIFNPSLYDVVVRALGLAMAPEDAFAVGRQVCGVVLLGVLGAIFARTRPADDRKVLAAMVACALALLLCSPAANPWYVTWVLPLALVVEAPAAVAFTFLAPLSYAFYLEGADLPWTRLVEYGPVYALVAWGLAGRGLKTS